MTVIRPNSVSGITSITAQANEINFFRSNGALGLQLNGGNFNTTTGVSTFNNLDVGGVLTYQDVTNVDSVGIITARSNIDCNGDLDVDGHTELDNINISGVSTHVGLSQFQNTINLTHASAGQNYIYFNEDLQFAKNGTGTRLKIDTSGRVLIGTAAVGRAGADELTIGNGSGDIGLSIRSGSSNEGNIYFSDSTSSGNGESRGIIRFDHSDDSMQFFTASGNNFSTEKLRIDASGRLIVGGGSHSGGSALVIKGGGVNTYSTMGMFGSASTPSQNDIFAQMRFGANGTNVGATINAKADADWGASNDYPSRLEFMTVPDASGTLTERFRIASNGDVKVISRGSSDSGAPFYVAVTGKSSIDYGGGSDDTACLRLKDVGSTNSYYHGIELRGKRDGDARIYMQDMGSDACDLAFATDNSGITEKMRITAAGRIGINKTDPEAQLHVYKPNHYVLTNSGKAVHHIHTSGPNGNAGEYGGAISFAMGSTGAAAVAGLQGAADADNVGLAFITHNSGTGSADATEMMRITSDGRIQANTQTTSDNEKYNFFFSGTADNQNCFTIRNDNSYDNVALIIKHGRGGLSGYSGKAVSFRGNDFTEEGSIVIGTSSVAYNTSSDYRLKENQVAISDGITRLKTLKPYRFNFKKDTGTTVDGFFAHEVTAVPEAVFGEKDAMKKIYYEEGDTLPSGKNVGDFKEFSSTEISAQSIDHSKLVPLLTAALQEAVTKIETLETKVAALEGG